MSVVRENKKRVKEEKQKTTTLSYEHIYKLFESGTKLDDAAKLALIENLFRDNEVILPESVVEKTTKFKEVFDTKVLPVLLEVRKSFEKIEKRKNDPVLVEYRRRQKELREMRKDPAFQRLKKAENSNKEVIEKMKLLERKGKMYAVEKKLNPLALEMATPKSLKDVDKLINGLSVTMEEEDEDEQERPQETEGEEDQEEKDQEEKDQQDNGEEVDDEDDQDKRPRKVSKKE